MTADWLGAGSWTVDVAGAAYDAEVSLRPMYDPTTSGSRSERDRAGAGLVLARDYTAEVVEPLLAEELPAFRVATARLGSGSDVLGLDDDISGDHDWGLRLTVLVDDVDIGQRRRRDGGGLPEEWRGHPTRFATTWDPTVRQRAEVASPSDSRGRGPG